MLVVLRLPNNIVIVSKINPSFFTIKEGSTFLTKPLFNSLYAPFGSPSSGGQKPQEREDVAGYAIALPEFWYRQRSLCPQGAANDSLRNRIAIVCRLAHQQDYINLPLSRKRFLKPCITLSAHS